MKAKGLVLVVLVAAVVLGITACSSMASAAETSGMTPEQTVESFYGWYISIAGYDPEADVVRNPLQDGSYAESELVSAGLVERIDAIVASFDGMGGYDPLICAQDIPQSVTVGEAEIEGGAALVPVTTSFEGHSFSVRLVQVGGEWQIDEVLCGSGS